MPNQGMWVDAPVDDDAVVTSAIRSLAGGRVVVLTEDPDGPGCLLAAAATIDAHTVNFLAIEGRGVLCVPLPVTEAGTGVSRPYTALNATG